MGLKLTGKSIQDNKLLWEFQARVSVGYVRSAEWLWLVDGELSNDPIVMRSEQESIIRHEFDTNGTYRVVVMIYCGAQRIPDSAVYYMVTIAGDTTSTSFISPASRFPDALEISFQLQADKPSLSIGVPVRSGGESYPAAVLSLLNLRGQVLLRQTIPGLAPGFHTVMLRPDSRHLKVHRGIVIARLDCPGHFHKQTLACTIKG